MAEPSTTSHPTETPVDADPVRSELADLVAPLWTAEHARQVLGLSRSAMSARIRAGSLLALVSAEGDTFCPVSQFESREGQVQVRPALRQFMTLLRDLDPWTIAVLIRTPAPELGDMTPLNWVRESRDTQVPTNYGRALPEEHRRR